MCCLVMTLNPASALKHCLAKSSDQQTGFAKQLLAALCECIPH